MKTRTPRNPVTDAQLDAALLADHDQILPSSGFADAVMTAVRADAAAPAPIPFPWKRAVPGLVGVVAGFALLVALLVALVSTFARSGPASAAGEVGITSNWKLDFAPLLHYVSAPDMAWITLAIAIPLVCLLALRRLIFSR
jgi:hypothetical protein